LEREDLADDPEFSNNRERVQNRDKLVPLLEPLVKLKSTRKWIGSLEAEGIPCGPIYDLEQAFADPQTADRGMRVEMDHVLAGKVPQVGSPFKMSGTPVEYRMPPPLLGEHTGEVLRDLLGLDENAIDTLRSEHII
jgi:crotonobetainyl-CoA:carnitine CoA-transferase CaiB-like acyl-CoA transferase